MSEALQEEKPEQPTEPTPTGFYSQKLWGLSFLALEPWAGWSGVGWNPSLLRCHPNLYPPHLGLGPAPFYISLSLPLHPSTHLYECCFFKSLVVRLPYSSHFLMVVSERSSLV